MSEQAIDTERAPRYPGRLVNRRIRCADGFTVSVQASANHYANDSHPSGTAAYWRSCDPDADVVHPFTTFEIGNPTGKLKPHKVWDEYDNGGVWAWVPRQIVADLLERHGGAVDWEPIKPDPATAQAPAQDTGVR